jgi:cyclophilin family peptidyl-prolyl cis-trans isomerase
LTRTARFFLCAAALALAAATATLQQSVASAAAGCTKVAKPPPKPNGGRKPPKSRLDPKKRYEITFVTNCGSFTIRLDVKHSPHTAASFFHLASTHFFDRTVFHRIVPGFVIQGGDPTGTGTGGPGYSTRDRPPASTRYTLGVVAMAKTQLEPPGTSGSQFFVVTVPDAQLPPDYAVLGRVVSGLKVVLRIGRLGNAAQMPTQTVEIVKTATSVSD